MYLHLEFTNGSNPYLKYGDRQELKKEIRRWKRNYNIVDSHEDKDSIQLVLREKRGFKHVFYEELEE